MQMLRFSRARDQVRDAFREMIVSGEIGAGSRLDETRASTSIGVSRTPLREALIALEQEGLVESRPHRGFLVIKPDPELVREAFPILAALEAEAVRLAGKALADAADELAGINEALAKATDRARQYDLDRAFHMRLTAGCANTRLQALLGQERARVRLIDGHHRKGMADLEGTIAEHREIVTLARQGRYERVAEQLRNHWTKGTETVCKWLEEQSR